MKMQPIVAALVVVGLIGVASADVTLAAEFKKPEGYPARSLELVVPWGTGGGSDQFARALARGMEKRMSTSIAVINKPGANSAVGLTYVLSQPADGYTLTVLNNDFMLNTLRGISSMSPDDFIWIARGVADVEMLFARTNDERFKTFDSYIEYAKAHPNELKIAIAGEGGIEHLSMALVNDHLGLKVKWVPFDKSAERYSAFLGGHTDLIVEEPSDMKPYLEEKRVKPLIQMLEKRATAFPDTPTAREYGADVTVGVWRGIGAKKGVPAEIAQYLQAVTQDALKDPEFVNGFVKKNHLDIREGFLGSEAYYNLAKKEFQDLKRALKALQR